MEQRKNLVSSLESDDAIGYQWPVERGANVCGSGAVGGNGPGVTETDGCMKAPTAGSRTGGVTESDGCFNPPPERLSPKFDITPWVKVQPGVNQGGQPNARKSQQSHFTGKDDRAAPANGGTFDRYPQDRLINTQRSTNVVPISTLSVGDRQPTGPFQNAPTKLQSGPPCQPVTQSVPGVGNSSGPSPSTGIQMMSCRNPVRESETDKIARTIQSLSLNNEEPMDDLDLDGTTSAEVERPSHLNVNFQPNEDGDNNLHLAIIFNEPNVAMCLIEMAADPRWLDLFNNRRQTPLHLATIQRLPTVIRRLLRRGARRSVYDHPKCNSPLHIACRDGRLDCVRELTATAVPQVLGAASPADDIRTAIETANVDGLTCLHLAAGNNHLGIVQHLIENCRVNVNLKELKRGCTILHQAVNNGNLQLVNYLLTLPSDFELLIDDETYDSFTALQLAQHRSHQPIIQRLLLAHAQPIRAIDSC